MHGFEHADGAGTHVRAGIAHQAFQHHVANTLVGTDKWLQTFKRLHTHLRALVVTKTDEQGVAQTLPIADGIAITTLVAGAALRSKQADAFLAHVVVFAMFCRCHEQLADLRVVERTLQRFWCDPVVMYLHDLRICGLDHTAHVSDAALRRLLYDNRGRSGMRGVRGLIPTQFRAAQKARPDE